jgi:hypothetical protein
MDERNRKSNKILKPSVSLQERLMVLINYGGCMGAIIVFTMLLRWLVGLFK